MKLPEIILNQIHLNFPWMYVILFTYGFSKGDYTNYIIEFITLLTIVYILKYSIQRERPNKENNLSFPSGHSALVWFLVWKIPSPFTISWALLVSYSRIYYLHHWWSDVVFSFFLSYWINFFFER